MHQETKLHAAFNFVFLTLALGAFGLNLFLLSHHIADIAARVSTVSGCGGGDCDEILASRWSVLFGVPVTAFGVLVWCLLITFSTWQFRPIHLPLLGLVLGAAAWFIFVQAFILKSFCPWCMAAHGTGIAAVVFGVIRLSPTRSFRGAFGKIIPWAAWSVVGIGLAQVYGPVPATHRIEDRPIASSAPLPREAESGRIAFFDDGAKSYRVEMLPRLGRADAKHILVELFDYQCPACRTMAAYLEALVARHPAEVAVLVLPMPLEDSCNAYVSPRNQHPGSCDTARIALAVWRKEPQLFQDFHRALFNDPSPESARRMALAIMPPERLKSALSDPWINEVIRADVSDWQAFSKTTDKLPKLLIRNRRILHGLPSGEEDFIRVMEQELGL